MTSLRPPDERLLGVADVAVLFGVCRATVYAMCEDGSLEHFRVRNRIRIPQAAAQRYLDGVRKGERT